LTKAQQSSKEVVSSVGQSQAPSEMSGRQLQLVPAAGIVSCSSLRRGPWRCISENDLWDSNSNSNGNSTTQTEILP
jgi:hypothetical protein